VAHLMRIAAPPGFLALLMSIVPVAGAQAQPRLTVIHNFGGGADGANPQATLVADGFGALYGTTASGGAHNRGTVFKIVRALVDGAWTATILHDFTGQNDGAFPDARLLLDGSGNLYGTTSGGGAARSGVAFELSRNRHGQWIETVLHAFGSGQDDAAFPEHGLVMDSAGVLYGSGLGGHFGFGAVFKLVGGGGGWTETTLHSFDLFDGYRPNDVLLDGSGSLFATTKFGAGSGSRGVAFSLTPAPGGGWTETTIHPFTGSQDGDAPLSGLLLGRGGALFGTTSLGGNFGWGTVFELKPAGGGTWTEVLLHAFSGGADGSQPQAGDHRRSEWCVVWNDFRRWRFRFRSCIQTDTPA